MEQKQTLSVRWVRIDIIATINYVAYLYYKCFCSDYEDWLFQESQNEQKFSNSEKTQPLSLLF
jgi:hypothetical protein